MFSYEFVLALCLTFGAGIATTLGGFASFFVKKDNLKTLALFLSFAAGVMLYVSYMVLLPQGKELLWTELSFKKSMIIFPIAFALGLFLALLIDKFLPDPDFAKKKSAEQKDVLKVGFFMAIVLAIHNFPEGLSTLVSAITNENIGYKVAFAMALHNIPEGIAIALPVYYLTGSRKKAFVYAFLSGLIEPIGAIIGYLMLLPVVLNNMTGAILVFVAGLMVYISFMTIFSFMKNSVERKLMINGLLLAVIAMTLYFYFG